MQKKGLIVIGVLLAVILCMQVRLLLRVRLFFKLAKMDVKKTDRE